MKRKYIYILCLATSLLTTGCFGDLDQLPMSDNSLTEIEVFDSPEEAKKALVKVYASLALTGQQGPAGSADISSIDEGQSQFTRLLFMMQELPTDMSINGWADAGIPNLNFTTWGADNGFNEGMYYRLGQSVSFANSFIENAASLADDANVQYYIAEARYIRAYAYYNLMDFYGNVPLQTVVSDELPEQNTREEIFNFIETELLAIKDVLMTDGSNEYGRVDEVAAWALLSRLYLNAESFTGIDRYADCVTYSEMAINSSYNLNTTDTNGNGSAYDELFCADNNTNGAQREMIFTANFDGENSQTYGGTTFLVCANALSNTNLDRFGVASGWDGNKVSPDLVDKFEATSYDGDSPITWADSRAVFATTEEGRTYEIKTIAQDDQGYATYKFTNVRADGALPNDPGKTFVDTDYPLIRLGEVYLNYAEAVLRGGGGSESDALSYINELRNRANASAASSIDLQYVLDERARELYFEGFRRTDLIRYGLFASNDYLWTFKGGNLEGKSIDSKYKIFPIPTSILNANKKMVQNPGY